MVIHLAKTPKNAAHAGCVKLNVGKAEPTGMAGCSPAKPTNFQWDVENVAGTSNYFL
jgi:hypothetical protein